jgi:hypothetical protein
MARTHAYTQEREGLRAANTQLSTELRMAEEKMVRGCERVGERSVRSGRIHSTRTHILGWRLIS